LFQTRAGETPAFHLHASGKERHSPDAEDPKNFDKVKVGDTVVFTYTEAVAIDVKPAPQPKK
jgi:hypothetical protein